MDIQRKIELLKELLGSDLLLEEILKALSVDEEREILDYIARMHDIQE